MPEIDALHIVIFAAVTAVGVAFGWWLRGRRAKAEKSAVSLGWQEQLNAQRVEHDRLTDQNKGLMEQISQYQASNVDAKNRARELSEAVQEAFARRDQLQREIKDIRANLEASVSEREQLQSDISAQQDSSAELQRKDERIAKLQKELKNWQDRLPPLLENFRQRNEDVQQLENELAAARMRIADLETRNELGQTRIEPVQDPDELTDGRDASNEALGEEDMIDPAELQEDTKADNTGEVVVANEDSADVDDVDNSQINGARDQLQAIKGVGPAIEKTLNEMGIFRFQQIAEMSEYDIDRVARRLKGFHSRIYREDWIGQARELRDQEAGV
tara:strand:- start:21501 stop:22493 length:993 start_codon:yes stop_codon:yes gene_type:complete